MFQWKWESVSMQHIGFAGCFSPIPRRMPIFHGSSRRELKASSRARWQNLEPKMSTEICQLDFLWLKGQSCEEDKFENINV